MNIIDPADMPATIPDRLVAHAISNPDETAMHVLVGEAVRTITWDELLQESAAYAEWFESAGVRPDDVVVLCLRHCASMYGAYLGAMLLGAIPSFVAFPTPKQDPELYWDAHRVLFGHVGATAVVTYEENAAAVEAILPGRTKLLVNPAVGLPSSGRAPAEIAAAFPRARPDGIALLQYSSGTTGHKKGVMLRHDQLARYASAYTAAMRMDRSDRVASWLPVYHDMGLLAAFLCPVHIGATVVSIDPFEWVEQPHMLLELMDRYRCQTTWLPNFAFNHLVRTKQGDETYRLDHVRAFVSASEPCKTEVFDRFVAAFAPHGVREDQIMPAYGMAESVMVVTFSPQGRPPKRCWFDATALRIGRAVPGDPGVDALGYLSNGPVVGGVEIRVDPRAAAVPGPGSAVGELQLRGPLIFDGYYRNPEATAAAFDGEWLRTGDLGCVIDGDVYVLGRTKDVIIHHGVNHYAHDLEAVVSAVIGVKPGRSVAVGVYDDAIGSERIEIVLERDEDLAVSDAEIRSVVRRAINERFQVTVARVHLVAPGWLVKTTSGKVSRSENLSKLLRLVGSTGGCGDEDADGLDTRDPAADATNDGLDGDADEVAETVMSTIATTFDVAAGTITAATIAVDVEGWDSLGHTVLMIRLGRALGTIIPEHVAAEATNVGELIELLRPYAGANDG